MLFNFHEFELSGVDCNLDSTNLRKFKFNSLAAQAHDLLCVREEYLALNTGHHFPLQVVLGYRNLRTL